MAAPTDFDSLARKKAEALVAALEKARADALRAEIDALRSLVDARSREAGDVGKGAVAALVEPLVAELTAAFHVEIDQHLKAAQTRADKTLAEAREQTAAEQRQAQEASEKAAAELRQANDAREQLAGELRGVHEAREHAVAELGRAQESLKQTQDLARQSDDRARGADDRARGAEERARGAEDAHRAAAEQLDAARQQVEAAKAEAGEHARRAERTEADVEAAQAASAAFLADIEEARESLVVAERAARDVSAERDEAVAASGALREQLASAEQALADARANVPDRRPLESGGVLDELAGAMRAMQHAASGQDVFQVVVERFAAHFERAAILIAGPAGLKCWLHRGFGDAAPDRMVLQAALEPAIKALDTQQVVAIDASGSPLNGLCGGTISRALAIPIVAKGKTIAVAYAENTGAMSDEQVDAGRKFAELLIEIGSRRVGGKRGQIEEPSSDVAEAVYAIQRQARRVKMREAVNITLDGSASFLVDLSTIGAQVLSPVPLRPKQEVNIALVIRSRSVECRGKVVWALFEQPKGGHAALYRAGVEFVDVDARGVEAFLTSESRRLARSA